MPRFLALTLFTLLDVAFAVDHDTTPAKKVVGMLTKLKLEVTAEGKKEEKEFNAYAGFCDKTENEKTYQIGRSDKKIQKTEADIAVMGEDIKVLSTDLVRLEGEKLNLQDQLSNATATREKEAKTYQESAKEIEDAVVALDRAAKSITASKSKGDLVGLAAMHKLAAEVLGSATRISLLELSASQLETLESLNAGSPSTSSSDDIKAMLRGLKSTFTTNKQTLDMQELEAKGTYNKLQMNLGHQLKYVKEDIDKKTLTASKKNMTKAQLQKELVAEEGSKSADQSFLKALTGDCTDKATVAADRKTKREEEITALTQAIDALAEGGVSMAQTAEHAEHAELILEEAKEKKEETKKESQVHPKKASSRTFLQMRETTRVTLREREIAKLEQLARAMHLPLLSMVVEKAKNGREDPLAETRRLIKGMIERMESSAQEEATTKTFCDEQVSKHAADRDNYNAEIERLASELDTTNATLRQAKKEVADLSKDISDLNAEVQEASRLRAREKTANEDAQKAAEDGEKATQLALSTLNAFYKGTSGSKTTGFLQTSELPGAPEVNAGSYSEAATERSGGVLAMLEVLGQDFRKSYTAAKEDESKAAEAFVAFQKDSAADIDAKEVDVTTKTAEISKLEVNLLQAQSDYGAAEESLLLTEAELDKLKGMCTENGESKKVRALKRKEEIETLKQTAAQLDEMIAAGDSI